MNWKVLIALTNEPLAAHAADVGVELTRSLKAELGFVYVIGEPSEIGANGGVSAEEAIKTAEEDGKDLIAAIRQRAPELAALEFMPIGDPAAEIIKAAREWPANLIVIGSHGRGRSSAPSWGASPNQSCAMHPVRSWSSRQKNRDVDYIREQLPTSAQGQQPSIDEQRGGAAGNPNGGLTSDEARGRLEKFGPNAMPDTSVHPFRMALEKFWAPVPWMLEAAVLLELMLGKYIEAAVIAALLVFNAALGLFQESRAQATLAALKSRLALNASVRRDGTWKIIPAVELVPGDVVKLSLGAVVAADVHLTAGEVLIDQSMLTGELVPIEAGAGVQTYAGALVRRGEALAEVTATGAHTKFGRTAELVRTAHVVSSQQKAVLHVVRNLAGFQRGRHRAACRLRVVSQDAVG